MRGGLEKVKDVRAQGVERLKEKNGIDQYTVVAFENEKDRDTFMKEISVPKYEQYVTADQVRRLEGRNTSERQHPLLRPWCRQLLAKIQDRCQHRKAQVYPLPARAQLV